MNPGDRVYFKYGAQKAWGTVRSAGEKRVHVQSGSEGVYIDPDDVLKVEPEPENRLNLLGERLRFSGGLGQ
ncbi:hypothetical protein [Halospeciosus flavus]|uniref:Hypervirulence associated protein TUDOR domain-containing protein n=1 Tax=Halospeciosus flavus TaxID=3032283 RepID=A0ABD5Z316_9EURY|nr:hypothetical protein [Halospeciosus flavus]